MRIGRKRIVSLPGESHWGLLTDVISSDMEVNAWHCQRIAEVDWILNNLILRGLPRQ